MWIQKRENLERDVPARKEKIKVGSRKEKIEMTNKDGCASTAKDSQSINLITNAPDEFVLSFKNIICLICSVCVVSTCHWAPAPIIQAKPGTRWQVLKKYTFKANKHQCSAKAFVF